MRIFVDLPLSGRALEILREGTAGHELVLAKNPATSVLADVAVDPEFASVEVAFGQPNPQAVAKTDHLRWMEISSSGFTRYDTAEFRALVAAKGIAVTHSAGVYAEACAVHALSFLLAQVRCLPTALVSEAPIGSEEWKDLRHRSSTLGGQRVLILGFGTIGRRLVELLAPFEVEVVAYRRQARGDEGIAVTNDLMAALSSADHVVNILPESGETRGLLDAERFAAMKSGAIFYNIGRGTTVDQEALRATLESGHLGGAWLDVTDPEPLPADHPLRAVRNCHVTPHIAGGHADETVSLVRHFVENFQRFAATESLHERIM